MKVNGLHVYTVRTTNDAVINVEADGITPMDGFLYFTAEGDVMLIVPQKDLRYVIAEEVE